MFDSQPFAVVVATVRMMGELVFVRRYVDATVEGWDHAVIYVGFLYVALVSKYTVMLIEKLL